MKRKVLAIVLSFAMVVCCIPTFAFAAADQMKVGDKDNDGIIDYVALGDSIAVGFGTGNCLATSYDGIYSPYWLDGYGRASSEAYSSQLQNTYSDTMNYWSGAMCGLRAEDVLYFIDAGDPNGTDKFDADAYFMNFFNNTFLNCYIDPYSSGAMNPFTYKYTDPKYVKYNDPAFKSSLDGEPVYYTEAQFKDAINLDSINAEVSGKVKNADFITLTAGSNNFFSYMTSKLGGLVSGTSLYSTTEMDPRCYYDYQLYHYYVYPYEEGDAQKVDLVASMAAYTPSATIDNNSLFTTGIYYANAKAGVTCSYKPIEGRSSNEKAYVGMMMYPTYKEDGTPDYVNMAMKRFSDADAANPTDISTKYDAGVNMQQYLTDMKNYYGQFVDGIGDEALKTKANEMLQAIPETGANIDDVTKVSNAFMEIYMSAMTVKPTVESLEKYYSKSIVNKFESAKTAAVKAAAVAGKLSKNENLASTVESVFDLIKSVLYTTAAFNEALPAVVEKIHELNPNAKIAITGLPPVFCDYAIKITDNYSIDVANLVAPFYSYVNNKIQNVADEHSGYCKAIDITKAEMMSQEYMRQAFNTNSAQAKSDGIQYLGNADSYGNCYKKTVDVMTFLMSALSDATLSHPSAQGNAYIAQQIDAAFDFTVEKKGFFKTIFDNLWNAIFNKDGKSLLERLFGFNFKNLFSGSLLAGMFK